jgi:hypothetical protein
MSGTGSLMIRNLRKASDYDKARIAQDDLLKIAIANDNNISNARRSYRQGEVPALTPQQQYTPDEIQADISKNYSDAITNLISLGFDYREASEIAARMGNDPTSLVILNNTFPSVKADFQKRFDVKRITPTGFLDFFDKFREVFEETKGIADNSVLFNDKFDRIINNINDLRAIIPTKDQVRGLSQSIKAQLRNLEGRADRRAALQLADIDDMLRRLARIIPDEAVYQRLAALPQQQQFQQLAQLQNRFDNLPSRDQVQQLLDRAPGLTAEQFRAELAPLANSISRLQADTDTSLQQSQQIIDLVNAGASKDEIREMFRGLGELPSKNQVQDLIREIREGRVGAEELREVISELIKTGIPIDQPQEATAVVGRADLSRLPPIEMSANVSVNGGIYDQIGLKMRGQHPQVVFGRRGSDIKSKGFGKEALLDLVDSSVALQQFVKRITGENWSNARTAQAKKGLINNFMATLELRLEEVSGRSPSMDTRRGEWIEYDFSQPSRSTSRSSSQDVDRSLANVRASTSTARTDRSRSASVESLERSPKGESGKGVMVMTGRKPILIKKIGRGLEPVETPSHIQFGKYLLHANNMNKSVLSVHHKGGGRVQSIPVQNMSEDLRDFIVEVIQNKKASQKEFSRLPLREQKLFEKMSKGAGVHHTLGLKPVKTDEDNDLEERFEVLKGEWFAGNNSHELVRELRKIVIHFMEEGRLTKSQSRELLLTIN